MDEKFQLDNSPKKTTWSSKIWHADKSNNALKSSINFTTRFESKRIIMTE